jgi:hypothetical protein
MSYLGRSTGNAALERTNYADQDGQHDEEDEAPKVGMTKYGMVRRQIERDAIVAIEREHPKRTERKAHEEREGASGGTRCRDRSREVADVDELILVLIIF